MEGLNLVPFPRQTLVGMAPSGTEYDAEPYDLRDYRTVHWTIKTYASLPGTVSDPARLYLQASNDILGPWDDLNPGGSAPANIGDTANGSVTLTARFLKARIVISADEVTTFAVQLVARRK